MRSRREEWGHQDPDDVAWVVEWQLAVAFRWLPLDGDGSLVADRHPEPGNKHWIVTIRMGEQPVRVPLPVRDLAKLIDWCHGVRFPSQLARIPANVRSSVLSLRAGLRAGLEAVDPLRGMGYTSQEQQTLGGQTDG